VSPRIGLGFDVHPFGGGGPLIVGGVTIPGSTGLAGHSDADVLAHAVADALLGAAGWPDLGTMFPAAAATPPGASSIGFLEEIAARLAHDGWFVVNIDAVITAEAPRLAPFLGAMCVCIATALEAIRAPDDDLVSISIKPKHAEGLGAIGRGEGIAAWAVALMERTVSPPNA
jgi:2-C-methyl-D-erythritol 2,4-cyclodiphosphate synthase